MINMPKSITINGRSSSITNAYFNGIIPVIVPTEEDIFNAYTMLNIRNGSETCAYCGEKATEWDHIRPLIKEKKPTGYITEIGNLIPSCGKCNQSKGNKDWKEWILSDANLSPKTRGVQDLNQRISNIEDYINFWETKKRVHKIDDYKRIIGSEKWEEYLNSYKCVIDAMNEGNKLITDIKELLKEYILNEI
jgi:hypothetical protein